MAKPAPKTALRKAPAAVHPVAPAAVSAGDDLHDPFLPGFDPVPSDVTSAVPTPEPVQAAETAAIPPSAGQPPAALAMFSVRMDPALRRRVKRYAAGSDASLQEVAAAALSEYLERHEG